MNPIELIAEVSSNHGGDLELAKAFIWQATEAGATFVKFQSYQVATLRPDDPQREWLAKAELSDDDHHVLIAECQRAGVQFLTTAFHHSRVPFLASLKLPALKIGSGEAGESRLHQAVYRAAFARVIVSTGRGGLIVRNWRPGTLLPADFLACVSRYPASERACLREIDRLPAGYGWSDHAVGIHVALHAMEAGARIIEKHVCLPEQQRPIRPWEATIADFKVLKQFADADPQQYVGRWQAI
jgi:N,N'-diacetyllegionaminate synthase